MNETEPKLERNTIEKKITVSGTIESIDTIEKELEKVLEDTGWGEDEIYEIRIAFREAAANAVKYGCGEGNPTGNSEKQIEIEYIITPEQIAITICDPGRGFDHARVEDSTAQENLLQSHGRGIFFMQQYADEVQYNELGNEVTLIKKKKVEHEHA